MILTMGKDKFVKAMERMGLELMDDHQGGFADKTNLLVFKTKTPINGEIQVATFEYFTS